MCVSHLIGRRAIHYLDTRPDWRADVFAVESPAGKGTVVPRCGRWVFTALACVALISLPGCRTAETALDEGRDLLSQGIDSSVRATAQLTDACLIAQTAWLPNVTPAEARASLTEALSLVDNVIAESPQFPGAELLRNSLASAQEAITEEDGAFGVSREQLQSACTFVNRV